MFNLFNPLLLSISCIEQTFHVHNNVQRHLCADSQHMLSVHYEIRESNCCVVRPSHVIRGRQKEHHKLSETSRGFFFFSRRSSTLLSFLLFPAPDRLFLLCAWHVITTLICVVSLSPPILSPSPLALLSLTLFGIPRSW